MVNVLTAYDPFDDIGYFPFFVSRRKLRNGLPYHFVGRVAVHEFGAGIPAKDSTVQSLAENGIV